MKEKLDKNPKVSTLSACQSIQWVQDENYILVIDEQKNNELWLEGDAALIWGWFNTGLSFSMCAQLLAALNGTSIVNASHELSSLINDWQEIGLLEECNQLT